MPKINDSGTNDDRLTAIQYAHLQRWKDGNYTNDWAGLPPAQATVTPDGMDRAALEACVGGAFFPGIEAGGLNGARPIIVASNYSEPFRLNHGAVSPGDITYVMALPWQNDFYQCADNWWPVPRPNYVIREGTSDQPFIAGVVSGGQGMVDNWHKLGFIVRQGAQHVEVDRCDKASINLLTPLLNFLHVPQGPMGMVRETALSITFEVIVAVERGDTTVRRRWRTVASTTSGLQQHGDGGADNVHRHRDGASVGDLSDRQPGRCAAAAGRDGAGLRRHAELDRSPSSATRWRARRRRAALVLDRSGSMSEDRGDGLSKHVSLQQAANIFVDVMLEGDGVGIVRFNEDAQVLQPVLELGNGGLSDLNRSNTKDTINGSGLDPNGLTSIGDGIFEGRGILNATTTPFDVKSLVVLTDGVENRPRFIADVATDINEFTYAVGLGQPQNISVSALQTISGNNGGYLLVTGSIGSDNRFLMQKYFLQILAGISNAEVVLDPEGQLLPGRVERVPFQLTAGDAGVDVILLTPNTKIVDFRVQTPSGQIIEPWRAMAEAGMRFVLSDGVSYYRLALPVASMIIDRFDAGGTWNALLTIGRPRLQRSGNSRDGSDPSIRLAAPARPDPARVAPARGLSAQRANVLAAEQFPAASLSAFGTSAGDSVRALPYSLVVHAYSNLSLDAHTEQASFEPGARVAIHATLAQSGIPLGQHAQVWAEVTAPGGGASTLALHEESNGQFAATLNTTRPGVYRLRIRARGTSLSGEPFTREKTSTAAVWRGGDRPPVTGGDDGGGFQVLVDYLHERDAKLCELLSCLLQRDGAISAELEKQLHVAGFDLDRIRKCLTEFCKGGRRCSWGE